MKIKILIYIILSFSFLNYCKSEPKHNNDPCFYTDKLLASKGIQDYTTLLILPLPECKKSENNYMLKFLNKVDYIIYNKSTYHFDSNNKKLIPLSEKELYKYNLVKLDEYLIIKNDKECTTSSILE